MKAYIPAVLAAAIYIGPAFAAPGDSGIGGDLEKMESRIHQAKVNADAKEIERVRTAIAGDLQRSGKPTIAAVRKTVSDQLKDPYSAKFDHVRLVSRNGLQFVCGMVNAKNSYGGYTGAEAFIADAKGVIAWENDRDGPYTIDLALAGIPAELAINPAVGALCG